MTKRDPQINVRLPQELKDELHAIAERNKRSVNAEVIAAIELALSIQGGHDGIVNEASKTIEGMGYSVKLMKPKEIDNFLHTVAKSAAEMALKELIKNNPEISSNSKKPT
ncbi:Arc family DNA-binding protein [Salmonella enterica]|nr:Arc family DNA-binding protein [Salmonella enterica]EGB6331308.1 Arc family DNA-binding protein [Salmonella enterica]EGC8622284.1 Arc family DNA-binding protein [Salmonella enterica]EIL4299235.1 Arc family DNA-binding protein [Salmonella enterica]EJV9785154.1 Arc family DNA-binding protein [Salmonella enterica]